MSQDSPLAKREHWGTRFGVILAVMGSAVGLGNFLRFPGLAARYDGGAFMIPYFIALLLLGLPLAWAEWALGRYGGRRGYNSSPGIYRIILKTRYAPYFGALAVLIPVGIYMYYVVIEAWCLGYACNIAIGALGPNQNIGEFFANFTGLKQDGLGFSGDGGWVSFFVLLCFALNFVIIYRGITSGIEWFCKWAMPALVLCALIVLVRVLTLGTPDPSHPELNVLGGLGFMWNPRTTGAGFWDSLANGKMWLEAASQIFFTLSVGFGIIVNYASYVRSDDDIALSALTSAAGNEFCEVALAGLIVIPAAFMFLGADGVLNTVTPPDGGTFALGFVTLPHVFSSMPLGQFIGAVFFFLLFIAALTSSLSMLQPAIALLEEGLGLTRKASVALLGFVTVVGAGFVLYFSKGLTAMDTFDFWVGTFSIYIVATFQIILFGWVFGIQRARAELDRGAEIRLPRLILYITKYIAPVYLIVVFIFFVYQEAMAKGTGNRFWALVHDPTVRLSVGFLALVLLLFCFITAASVRRWRRMEVAQPDDGGAI